MPPNAVLQPSCAAPSTPTTLPRSHVNAIVRRDPSKTQLVRYHHGTCGSPTTATWQQAVRNGNFLTWPGLDSVSIGKHLPKSVSTAKGYLDQERANLQSTQSQIVDPDSDSFFPVSDRPNVKSFDACAAVIPFVARNTAYHDLTGRFPHRSSRGHEYLLVVYDHDSNAILQCPLKNKTAGEIKRGWQSIHERLSKNGNQPKLYILDNEASALLKSALKKYELDYQLVPPHVHRRNAAERAIRTWKNHFQAGLCSTDTQFPLHLWDRLIPQATITLNLLRASRRNPTVSVHHILEGCLLYTSDAADE